MGGLAFHVYSCGCEHVCRERKRGLQGACLWAYLGLTCPCRARSGYGWALALCRGEGHLRRGLGEGDGQALSGVPRLRDQGVGEGGQALGCRV